MNGVLVGANVALAGIHLSDKGEPICVGDLRVSGNDAALSPHDQVRLSKQGALFAISDYRADADTNSGFYPITDHTPAVMLILPASVSTFVETRLREPIANGAQSITIEGNDQIDPQSAAAGYAIIGGHTIIEGHAGEKPYTHLVQSMKVHVQPVAEGIGFALTATLTEQNPTSRKRAAPQQIEASFLVNRETRMFRFHHRIEKQNSRPGLRRAYAGDEVQTNRAAMNITHPLVYNTGGTFALSPHGTHSADITKAGTYIQPVALTGWGWGSVYRADTQTGRNELALPWLTRDLIRTALKHLGRRSGDKIVAHINRHDRGDGNFGYFTQAITGNENNQRAINQRFVESINTEFSLDHFGLTLTLDARLSDIAAETLEGKADQGSTYKKTFLLPWEVLILRDFDVSL